MLLNWLRAEAFESLTIFRECIVILENQKILKMVLYE